LKCLRILERLLNVSLQEEWVQGMYFLSILLCMVQHRINVNDST